MRTTDEPLPAYRRLTVTAGEGFPKNFLRRENGTNSEVEVGEGVTQSVSQVSVRGSKSLTHSQRKKWSVCSLKLSARSVPRPLLVATPPLALGRFASTTTTCCKHRKRGSVLPINIPSLAFACEVTSIGEGFDIEDGSNDPE